MTERPAVAEANATFVRMGFAAQAPMALFEAELLEIAPGSVTIAFPVADRLTTVGTGIVMGGVLATVADVAAGLSILTVLDPPRPVTTIDFAFHAIAAAKGERIVCVGQVERAGRQISITGADVFAEEAGVRRKVARLTASFFAAPV